MMIADQVTDTELSKQLQLDFSAPDSQKHADTEWTEGSVLVPVYAVLLYATGLWNPLRKKSKFLDIFKLKKFFIL